MAVAELIAAIEEKFGFELDEADFTADIFDTVGSLSDFVAAHRQ
jgi:acyl carrier protein